MFKIASAIALISLASSAVVQITDQTWELTAPQTQPKHRLGSEASYISWSECASEHKYDVAAGTATPNPPVVGSWVTLNVDVIFNDDVTVTGLFINVLFTSQGQSSPVNLYSADFASANPA